MKDSLIYYSAAVFGAVMRMLPLSVALGVGRMIGLMGYALDFKNRAKAYANVKQAFVQTKSSREILCIVRGMYMNFGMNIIELFRLPLLNPNNFDKVVEIEGREHIEQALKRGKGVVLVGMHAGSWELANVVSAMLGFPYLLFANVQKRYSKLDRLLNHYRTCGGSVLLNKGTALRDIIAGLKENKVVGMVADQGGRKGELIPFFGRTASMNSGVIRLARNHDAAIIWSSIRRLGNGRHKMVFSEPMEVAYTDDEKKDITDTLKDLVQRMEKSITEVPEEYMWIYKIWKFSNQARICILSDGKMGHQRQSEAVAQILQKVLIEQRKITAEVNIIKIAYKQNWTKHFLALMSIFPLLFFHRGKLGVLKWFLTSECYSALMKVKADYIISCGSSTAALNFLIAKDHKAKKIVNLKPGLLSYNDFDLVILPQHDKPTIALDRCRFAITASVPNTVTKEFLQNEREHLEARFSHIKNRVRPKIGILLGGDAKDVWLSEKQITILLKQLSDVAQNLNYDLMITTSRRTSARVDQMVLNQLKHNDRCLLIVQPNTEDIPHALGGIMGMADLLVVSGDSLSMISEAVASKKMTIVFTPEMRNRRGKHIRFIKKLSKEGFIISVDVTHIAQQIYDISKRKVVTKKITDEQIIYKELCEVI